MNIAQLRGIAATIKLVTFDADGTIYQDGHHIEQDNTMIAEITTLMEAGCHIAIVTAAGYPGETVRFEERVRGLLDHFRDIHMPREVLSRFHIMGGECNYLLNVDENFRLQFVAPEGWMSPDMLAWEEESIAEILHDARWCLEDAAERLQVPVEVIQKERAVGVVPTGSTIYEVLEEMAITVQMHLGERSVPFCAFNGGNDVFVDIGDNSHGLESLMRYVGCRSGETLHVGDRFTLSGNDSATRDVCAILWVACPEETAFFIRLLTSQLRRSIAA